VTEIRTPAIVVSTGAVDVTNRFVIFFEAVPFGTFTPVAAFRIHAHMGTVAVRKLAFVDV